MKLGFFVNVVNNTKNMLFMVSLNEETQHIWENVVFDHGFYKCMYLEDFTNLFIKERICD